MKVLKCKDHISLNIGQQVLIGISDQLWTKWKVLCHSNQKFKTLLIESITTISNFHPPKSPDNRPSFELCIEVNFGNGHQYIKRMISMHYLVPKLYQNTKVETSC